MLLAEAPPRTAAGRDRADRRRGGGARPGCWPHELRRAGIAVDLAFKGKPGQRMKRADRLGARWAVSLGDDELARGVSSQPARPRQRRRGGAGAVDAAARPRPDLAVAWQHGACVRPTKLEPDPRPPRRAAGAAGRGRARRLRQARQGILRPRPGGRRPSRPTARCERELRELERDGRSDPEMRDLAEAGAARARRRGCPIWSGRCGCCCCPRTRPTRRARSWRSAPAPAATRRRCSRATCCACTSATPT